MTALPWFRLYHRTIDDTKIKLLAFEDRWHFIALCCLTANGTLAEADDDLKSRMAAVALGVQLRELDEIKRRLMAVNLIGADLVPLAWDDLQFQSDTSTPRVQKFREKQRRNKAKRCGNVTVTVQETETDAETEAKSEEDIPAAKATGMARNPFPKPVWADPYVWADFLVNRKKAKNTATAYKGFLADIAKLQNDEWPPARLLEYATTKGWQAIYEPKEGYPSAGQRNSQGIRSSGGNIPDKRSSLARAIDEGIEFLGTGP
jgi:hypothetical protein